MAKRTKNDPPADKQAPADKQPPLLDQAAQVMVRKRGTGSAVARRLLAGVPEVVLAKIAEDQSLDQLPALELDRAAKAA